MDHIFVPQQKYSPGFFFLSCVFIFIFQISGESKPLEYRYYQIGLASYIVVVPELTSTCRPDK
jgi:hypothetical protein